MASGLHDAGSGAGRKAQQREPANLRVSNCVIDQNANDACEDEAMRGSTCIPLKNNDQLFIFLI
jgi:hypothetical protein